MNVPSHHISRIQKAADALRIARKGSMIVEDSKVRDAHAELILVLVEAGLVKVKATAKVLQGGV